MIKVMSQNVMCWEQEGVGTFAQRRPLMKKALTQHGADIIGIQELVPVWEQFFKEDLCGFEYILKYRSEKNLEGTPIYWDPKTVQALKSGYFWLSETPDKEGLGWDAKCVRITCWVHFKEIATDREFVFMNTHLDHRGEIARQEGIKQICRFIKDNFGEDMPLVLTGDFNATPDSPTIATADSLLADARKKAAESTDKGTFHGWKELDSTIDYIYLSNSIKCHKFERVTERRGDSYQSDHHGILATIEI